MRNVAGSGLRTTVAPLTCQWGITMVILGVILRITYMILMTEIVLGDDSYDKSCDPKVILAGTLYFGNVYQCS